MNPKLYRKAAGIGMIVLAVVIVLLVLWALLKYASRECSYDSQCPQEHYCGSDFKCHQVKVVEKTVVINDYSTAAAIISIALIIAVLLLRDNRWNSITNRFFSTKKEHQHPMHPQYKDMYWKKK
ncbi:hypothetical protein HYV81_05660 [Candidatus Woesearchaeota archaeon]|nr:hypothetical protein [Candidatus Woesearchaeota archaeon]